MEPSKTVIDEVCPVCNSNLEMPKHNPFKGLIMVRCINCDWVASGRNGRTLQQLLGLKLKPKAEDTY